MIGRGGFVYYTDNFQCYECGKFAYKSMSWAYKRQTMIKGKNSTNVYFCSYSCMRLYDKRMENKKKAEKEAKRKKNDKETASTVEKI